jgi:hypothetical protein
MERREIPRKSPETVIEEAGQKLNPITNELRALDLESLSAEIETSWKMHNPDADKTSLLLTRLGGLRTQMEEKLSLIKDLEKKIGEYPKNV